MLSFECIKNEKSVYFLLTSAFVANIGRGEAQTFHIPKWISCEGSAAFTQNIPQGDEVHRPASGCMKPCRNGVIIFFFNSIILNKSIIAIITSCDYFIKNKKYYNTSKNNHSINIFVSPKFSPNFSATDKCIRFFLLRLCASGIVL